MSKEFESEYKNYIQNDIPDLWARIECALPAKNIEVVEQYQPSENVKNIDINAGVSGEVVQFRHIKKSYNDQLTDTPDKNKTRKKRRNLAMWSAIAVACLVGVIAIPAIINTKKADAGRERRRSDNSVQSITWSTDSTKDDVAYDAEYEDYDAYDAYEYEEAATAEAESDYDMMFGNSSEDMNSSSEKAVASEDNPVISNDTETSAVTVSCKIDWRYEDEEGEVYYDAIVTSDIPYVSAGTTIRIYSLGGMYDNYAVGDMYTGTLFYIETMEDGIRSYSF